MLSVQLGFMLTMERLSQLSMVVACGIQVFGGGSNMSTLLSSKVSYVQEGKQFLIY